MTAMNHFPVCGVVCQLGYKYSLSKLFDEFFCLWSLVWQFDALKDLCLLLLSEVTTAYFTVILAICILWSFNNPASYARASNVFFNSFLMFPCTFCCFILSYRFTQANLSSILLITAQVLLIFQLAF